MRDRIIHNVVDLFCGCGGLSLGFDAYRTRSGNSVFRTILAVDNWKPAVEVFGWNHPPAPGARQQIGRRADLSWFNHPSEALLFYLAHYAGCLPGDGLATELSEAGFENFLSSLKVIDEEFQKELTRLAKESSHKSTLMTVDAKVFSLALAKSTLGKLHLSSLRELSLDLESLPWTDEYSTGSLPKLGRMKVAPGASHLAAAAEVWDLANQQVSGAASSKGRGQHRGNASRMSSLLAYFESPAGEKLSDAWRTWFASRLAVRSAFCLAAYEKLKVMYTEPRRVSILLGGPPCKGFSRIGRAVIRELREQGAHAWACNKFGDERNALMYRYVVFLEALQPGLFIFENVSNFASKLKTPDGEFDAPQLLEELIESLDAEDVKYDVDATIVRARNHGIPQARERYIMCGIKVGSIDLPPSSILSIRQYAHEVTLGEALSGLSGAKIFRSEAGSTAATVEVADPPGQGAPEATAAYYEWIRKPRVGSNAPERQVDSHIFRQPRVDDARFYKLLAPGVRWMDLKTPAATSIGVLAKLLEDASSALARVKSNDALLKRLSQASELVNDSLALRLLLEQSSVGLEEPHHLLSDGYLANGSGQHGDWLERLSANRPCKTVVAHIGKDTYGYVHPFEPRPITIREAARVQAFPDWFSFAGVGVVDAYSMIGNAVPPLLAYHFAERVAVGLGLEDDDRRSAAIAPLQRKRAQRNLPFG